MSNENGKTPRERLEAETRIIARSYKAISIEAGDDKKEVRIMPLSYCDLEDLASDIAKLIANFFSLAAKAANLQFAVIPSSGSGVRSAGADEKSEAPAEQPRGDDALAIQANVEELFKPEIFLAVAHKFTGVVKRLVETGTDIPWEEVSKIKDFTVPIRLALEVLKFNIGPELKDFFVKDVSEVLSGLRTGKIAPATATTE